MQEIQQLDPHQLVFVDECGSHLGLVRAYARSPKGHRALGQAPRKRGVNLSLIAAMRLGGFGAELAIEGAVDAQVFVTWVNKVLVPWLKPGEVVIWDNLPVHYYAQAKAAVEAAECRVIFLPAYSPDYSPIEGAFSKIKAKLRALGARTKETLLQALADSIQTISSSDILGWFLNAGYSKASLL